MFKKQKNKKNKKTHQQRKILQKITKNHTQKDEISTQKDENHTTFNRICTTFDRFRRR